AGALDGLALLDVLPLAEQRGADVVLLEVEREADDAVLQLEHLERDGVLEPVDAGDPVADLQHGPDLGEVGLDVVLLDPLLQDRGDLFRPQFHEGSSLMRLPALAAAARAGRARSRRAGTTRPG